MSESTQAQEQLTQDIADTPSRNPIVHFFKSHPKGFWFIFWGEFAERCSFYGMKAILTLYMTKSALAFARDDASVVMSLFMVACYFLPLLGGYLADNFLGKYWSIICFC